MYRESILGFSYLFWNKGDSDGGKLGGVRESIESFGMNFNETYSLGSVCGRVL